jgi:hypothetical protein
VTFPRSVPDEDHVATIMADLAVSESQAWMILALERGEIDGDVVLVDDDAM